MRREHQFPNMIIIFFLSVIISFLEFEIISRTAAAVAVFVLIAAASLIYIYNCGVNKYD